MPVDLNNLGDENRDILLHVLAADLEAEGKPLPQVTEAQTGPRGKLWYRLTWIEHPDTVVKIDNRGYWLLANGQDPQRLRTFVSVSNLIDPSEG